MISLGLGLIAASAVAVSFESGGLALVLCVTAWLLIWHAV